MSSKNKRLFIAAWPDQVIRSRLRLLQEKNLEHEKQNTWRPTHIQDLHLTLKYLGATSSEMEQKVSNILASLEFDPVQVCLDQLIYWRRPKVLVAQAEDCPVSLTRLASQIDNLMAELGFVKENRSYKAHITLARKGKYIMPAPIIPVIKFNIKSIALVESCSGPNLPRYCLLKSWPG